MALKVINKKNSRLKFLHRKTTLRRLLCNVISAWYPNLTGKIKIKIQIMQNNCIQYCLQLDKMTSKNELEILNWLLVKKDSTNP